MPLHVLERKNDGLKPIKPFNPGPKNYFTCGAWTMTATNAKSVIGDYIFLHAPKKEPARAGGIIQDYFINPDNDIVFIVELNTELRGTPPPNTTWRTNQAAWTIV